MASQRPHLRDFDLVPGIYPPGPWNALTDVPGVRVGHITLIEGKEIRTGATAVLPHPGNLFQEKVPCGLAAGNGYGKLTGATQVKELGELETPVVLTNTLAVARGIEAILDWTLEFPGNEEVTSVNAVVGETNDSLLNNIRKRALTSDQIRTAIDTAQSGPVPEGTVGAGVGTVTFGWKGGIGTSSRRLPEEEGGYTLGVLVQSNFGGELRILGRRVQEGEPKRQPNPNSGGSIMILLATDALLSDRNLTRLARRCLAGLANTGASFSNFSGDYALAFSTNEAVRRTPERRNQASLILELPNNRLSPLFQAAIEATEEAILNSLLQATTVTGYRGLTVEAIPLDYFRQPI